VPPYFGVASTIPALLDYYYYIYRFSLLLVGWQHALDSTSRGAARHFRQGSSSSIKSVNSIKSVTWVDLEVHGATFGSDKGSERATSPSVSRASGVRASRQTLSPSCKATLYDAAAVACCCARTRSLGRVVALGACLLMTRVVHRFQRVLSNCCLPAPQFPKLPSPNFLAGHINPTPKPTLQWQPSSDDWQDRHGAGIGKEAKEECERCEGRGRGQEGGCESKSAHTAEDLSSTSPVRTAQAAARGQPIVANGDNGVRRRKTGETEKAPPVQRAARTEAKCVRDTSCAEERTLKGEAGARARQALAVGARARQADGEVELRTFEQEPQRNREVEVRRS
jgi:hypothetical protein